MHRSLFLLAAAAAFSLAAPLPVSSGDISVRDTLAVAGLKTVSFARRQDNDEDLEMGATPFGKRQDDDEDLEMGGTPFKKRQDDDEDLEIGGTPFAKRQDDEEDLEMGATPFGKRQNSDGDLEMGGTPFGKRGIYDKVDVDGFRLSHLKELQPIGTEAASK